MGFLGELIGAGKTGGSKLASRFGRAARLSRKAAASAGALPKRVPGANMGVFERGRAASSYQIPVTRTKNIHGNTSWMHDEYRRLSNGRRAQNAMSFMANPLRKPKPVPANLFDRTFPKAINQKGKSGFSHGKKLAYGAAGVGAMGLAWGVTQRNKSTDSSGYRQSRGMYNY